MSRRRRPVEPWRQRALAQREAERARASAAGDDGGSAPAPPEPPESRPGEPTQPGPAELPQAPAQPPETLQHPQPPEAFQHPQPPEPLQHPQPPESVQPPPPAAMPQATYRPDRRQLEHELYSLDSISPEVTAPPKRERRRGPRFNLLTGTLLLSGIALIGGFFIVNLVLMPSFTRQGSEVPVPEVIGLSEREAERSLASLDLRLSKISEQWSADVPRGFVTMQEPPPGGVVKRGRRISVVVSLGAQGTSVPVLDGSSERQAGILLESSGLRRGKIARVYTEEVGRDLVIATDPPGETVVEQETVVDLLVSLGPPPRGYVLPDLTGRSVNGVTRGLRDEGFSVATREGGPRQKSDAVASHDPPPGHRVAPRDSVILYYHP